MARQNTIKNLKENIRIYLCTFFQIHSYFRKPDHVLNNGTKIYKTTTPKKCLYCRERQYKPFKKFF